MLLHHVSLGAVPFQLPHRNSFGILCPACTAGGCSILWGCAGSLVFSSVQEWSCLCWAKVVFRSVVVLCI